MRWRIGELYINEMNTLNQVIEQLFVEFDIRVS